MNNMKLHIMFSLLYCIALLSTTFSSCIGESKVLDVQDLYIDTGDIYIDGTTGKIKPEYIGKHVKVRGVLTSDYWKSHVVTFNLIDNNHDEGDWDSYRYIIGVLASPEKTIVPPELEKYLGIAPNVNSCRGEAIVYGRIVQETKGFSRGTYNILAEKIEIIGELEIMGGEEE